MWERRDVRTLGTVGLFLDVIGVCILFVYTSGKRIISAVNYHNALVLMEDLARDGKADRVIPGKSAQDIFRELETEGISVKKDLWRGRWGLLLIGAGFVLQALRSGYERESTCPMKNSFKNSRFHRVCVPSCRV